MSKSFKDYLIEVAQEAIMEDWLNVSPQVWIENLETEDIIDIAEGWGGTRYFNGKVDGANAISLAIGNIV